MTITIDGKPVTGLEAQTIKLGVKKVLESAKRQLDKANTMPAVQSALREEYNIINALAGRLEA